MYEALAVSVASTMVVPGVSPSAMPVNSPASDSSGGVHSAKAITRPVAQLNLAQRLGRDQPHLQQEQGEDKREGLGQQRSNLTPVVLAIQHADDQATHQQDHTAVG